MIREEQNNMLLRPVCSEEVKEVVFKMYQDKSPVLDGMNPTFYQKYWDIVGVDVVETIRQFFNAESMPTGMNETNLILITNEEMPREYEGVAFDLLVQFLHYFKRKQKGRDGFIALKLDLSKACDRVECSYLYAILSLLGFVDKVIRLIYGCLSSVHYLYCKANDREVTIVLRLLKIFAKASGQLVNFSKSCVFFSTNTSAQICRDICSRMGLVEVDESSEDLRLPSVGGINMKL
ncbi:uncharacterized protein LOC133030565 [Cannabis sativa]|uniref:uncharacterized protein LOC133030565 n=1 Tax=Cannabis sativa TaxID=3483 RepID=UPI0029CA9A9A|nr:uncharacterized protein LOC133030565 [Cannabis sativa]